MVITAALACAGIERCHALFQVTVHPDVMLYDRAGCDCTCWQILGAVQEGRAACDDQPQWGPHCAAHLH